MYEADLKHPDKTLEHKLHMLYDLNRYKIIDLSFRPPYLDLLHKFGHPHHHLPPVIHIAGTNGKGSIVAMLRAVLEQAGYKVHAYTSPHLLHFNERLYLAGEDIEDGPLEALIDEALDYNEGREVTFFEITTALSFAAFSRERADILLLETGLGGRLDCTNVIEKPLVSIISKISYDHMEYLGETLQEIAAEKAGIMKKGVPCIIGMQSEQAIKEGGMDVFEEKAEALGVKLYRAGHEWLIEQRGEGMCFTFDREEFILPLPNLQGLHQIENAGAALAAMKIIECTLPVSPASSREGLCKIKWGGRLQLIQGNYGLEGGRPDIAARHDLSRFPSSRRRPGSFPFKPEDPGLRRDDAEDNRDDAEDNRDDGGVDWELWYDCGHNDSAGEALARQAQIWVAQDDRPLHIILGMKADKAPQRFLEPLLPFIKSLTLIPIPGIGGSIGPENLQGLDIAGISESKDVKSAVQHVCENNQKPGRILICGSLYLAGQILMQNHK